MSHGWGGEAKDLRPDAIEFAKAGFLVVIFDYRGWGNSDSRLIASAKPIKKDGKLTAEVVEVRGELQYGEPSGINPNQVEKCWQIFGILCP